MNRRLLALVAVLVALSAWKATPQARADRLGGNYRGPDDTYIVREESTTSAPGSSSGGGSSEGGSDSGGGTSGGSSSGGSGDSGGGASGGSSGSGDGGGGGGDGGGGGGDGGGGDGGGGDGGGAPQDPGGASGSSGDSGGGSSGGSSSGGDSGGEGDASGASGTPTSPGSGGGPTGKGKGAAQEDKDKIWPFYVEKAKEEYLLAVLSRRPEARLSPRSSSTGLLSPLPDSGRERRPVGETDRLEAKDLVMQRLSDPDSRVRDAAVLALGKSGYKEALQGLQKVADSDADPAVREDALLALGLSGQKDTVLPILLKALKAKTNDRRDKKAAFAALGLGLLGDRDGAAESLREFYHQAAGRVDMADEAACASVALGMLGDPAALPVFQKVLAAKGATDSVRAYTIHALGKYGNHSDEKVRASAMNTLFACLKDKKDVVKQSALLALGSFSDGQVIGPLLKEGLGDADPYAKIFAAHSLGRIAGRSGPSSVEYKRIAKSLAEVAENDNRDRWLFQAGNLSLASMAFSDQEKPLLELVEQMKKLNPNSASAVILSLGIMGTDSPAVAKKLQGTFESRSSGANVQAYAGLAMAMSGTPGAADMLSKSLKAESRPQADVARSAALALGLVGGAKEADLLVGILKGDTVGLEAPGAKVFLMGAAVQGLGLIGDGDTVKKLKPVLESRQWLERAFGTAALGYMLEPKSENRVSPRISEIFRHHNYHQTLSIVKTVQSIL